MKNGRIQFHTTKMENKTTNRAKMSNKRCIKARLQYLQRGYIKLVSDITNHLFCFILTVFLADLLDSPSSFLSEQ